MCCLSSVRLILSTDETVPTDSPAATEAKTRFSKDGTAQGVAKQRLIETLAAADKRVINDPYAAKSVFGAGLIKLIGHRFCVWLGQRLAPGFHEHLIARTRFIDDHVPSSMLANNHEVKKTVLLNTHTKERERLSIYTLPRG